MQDTDGDGAIVLILPYAFPAFISALVWRGLFNAEVGQVNQVLQATGFGAFPWLNDGLCHPFHVGIWNSVKVLVITAALTVGLTALGAYAFSRFRFHGRRGGLFTLILIQMFPQMLAMVAIYLLMLEIGSHLPWLGLDTRTGLIMVYLGGALDVNTWLMKGYFDTIARSLEESAMMDGASPRAPSRSRRSGQGCAARRGRGGALDQTGRHQNVLYGAGRILETL